jgi:colanic acid biosynthesis glycosyl transferase WcaI
MSVARSPAACRNIRVLVLSLYYAPEITGNAPIVTELARMLAADGFTVQVVAGTPHYRLPEVPARYRRRLYVREVLDGVAVTRCYAYPKSDGVLPKLLNYSSCLLTATPACLLAPRADVILVVSPPFLLGLIGALVRLFRGSRVVYNAQDLFPEGYAGARVAPSGLFIRLVDLLQRWVFRLADAITVITPGFQRNLLSKGVPAQKIQVIPNFADHELVQPGPRDNPFARQHNLLNKFVVLSAGNIGFTRGTEVLVAAAKRLESCSDIIILVVGAGSERARLVRAAEAAGLGNMRFLPPQPTEILPLVLAAADVGVVTTRPGIAHASFPSRIYGLMAAARPVVGALDADSDPAELIRRAQCGLVVKPGNVEEITEALRSLRADETTRRRMGENGRQHLLEHYSKQTVSGSYAALLRQLAGN